MMESKQSAEVSGAATTQDTPTLFERIGGKPAVRLLVKEFYDRVLADPELAPFFADTSMDKLRAMQYQFFCAALEGPIEYSGRPIAHVHRGRGITARHLQRFLDHLLATVENLHPNEDDVREIIGRINMYSDDITSATTFSG